MVLEITNSERDLFFELIESAHREMIQEIDHTDAGDFRKLLQEKIELLEHVGAKIGGFSEDWAELTTPGAVRHPPLRGGNGLASNFYSRTPRWQTHVSVCR